jgi:8-oxo-dGTP pyrophosphatase MutT (NUDIX family)
MKRIAKAFNALTNSDDSEDCCQQSEYQHINYVETLLDRHPKINKQHPKLSSIITKNKACEINMLNVIKSKKFIEFIKNIDNKLICLMAIEVRDIYMFGPNVGFIFVNCTMYEQKSGVHIQASTVFIRGGSVGIFVIVKCQERKYALLTRQIRVPGGRDFVEVVAGMLDENGAPDSKGVAIKELKEESGLILSSADLIQVATMYPSIGGCDEMITCFITREIDISPENLSKIQTSVFGVDDESIHIEAHPINTSEEVFQLAKFGDSKLNTCLLAYIERTYNLAEKQADNPPLVDQPPQNDQPDTSS